MVHYNNIPPPKPTPSPAEFADIQSIFFNKSYKTTEVKYYFCPISLLLSVEFRFLLNCPFKFTTPQREAMFFYSIFLLHNFPNIAAVTMSCYICLFNKTLIWQFLLDFFFLSFMLFASEPQPDFFFVT